MCREALVGDLEFLRNGFVNFISQLIMQIARPPVAFVKPFVCQDAARQTEKCL